MGETCIRLMFAYMHGSLSTAYAPIHVQANDNRLKTEPFYLFNLLRWMYVWPVSPPFGQATDRRSL